MMIAVCFFWYPILSLMLSLGKEKEIRKDVEKKV
jgi:hypothetical protein